MRVLAALFVSLLTHGACKPAPPRAPVAATEESVLTAPPDAEQRPHTHIEHGVPRDDPYHWMRDREDPALLRYLQAENAHTEAQLAHLAGLRQRLFDELLGRIQEDDATVPARDDGWWYYTRTEAGKPYAIHCRRRGSEDAPEEVILDENALAEGKAYFDLGAAEVSPDHRLLAYAVDEVGRELYTLRFRDLETGRDLPDVVTDVWPDLAWASDDATLFYTRLDESLRPWQVARHTLGEPTSADAVVHQEDDDRFRVWVERTRDDRWILVGSSSSTTSEVRYQPADRPRSPLTLFAARHPGHEYRVDSQGDRFLVLTNDSDDATGAHDQRAVNFQLKEARPGATERHQWRTLVAHRPDVTLTGVEPFAGFVVLLEREAGATWFRVLGRAGGDHRIPMPEAVFVVAPGDNPSFDQEHFRFTYTSLTTPASTYDYEVPIRRLVLRKEQVVRGGYDKQAYVSERLHATAPDGVQVPISLVRRRDTPVDGSAPLLLYGYGAYGLTIEPTFSSNRLSLLDRGVIYAIAHVRGGGFLGRTWKEAGKFERKQNTFDDFVAAGRHLVAQGYTTHQRLAIQGGSAGGLLVGAVINQAPDLAAYAVAQVPFVDVVSTMLDESIPLTSNEWEEWGDPREERWFRVMLAYSPYDNIRHGPYPDLLVTSGLHDPRVQYWEPTKWVARLRDRATNDPQLLLKMELDTGHGGKTGRYGWLEDVALVQAWLLDRWGLASRP